MVTKADFFKPENLVPGSTHTKVSPSGKYSVEVSKYTTGPGTWEYAQGIVRDVASGRVIKTLQYNYHHLPVDFVEGHQNGHDYLISGEDYQSQTIVELDTGKSKEISSKGANVGAGFCWVEANYHPGPNLLMVNGCIWACPYEYRFYDFADPMNGWPEIDLGDCYADPEDVRKPQFGDDGSLTIFQTWGDWEERSDEEWDRLHALTDEEYDAHEYARGMARPIASWRKFHRKGQKWVKVDEYVSAQEAARRKGNDEARARHNEWVVNFKATDPLYREMIEQLKDPSFNPSDYDSVGNSYDGCFEEWSGKERTWNRRITDRKRNEKGVMEDTGWTMDLMWAVDTGPLKLQTFLDGKTKESKIFPEHSVESMRAVFEYAKNLMAKKVA